MTWGIKITLGQVLEISSFKYPDNIAVKDAENVYTYRELNRLSDDLAKGFVAMGISKGTHVGVFAGNTAANVCCFYALWKIGAVLCPLCTTYSITELEYCVEKGDITHLVTGKHPSGHCEQLCAELGDRVRLISQRDFDEYIKRGDFLSDVELNGIKRQVSYDDVDTILFSSGTTGKSKPVVTTHFNRVTTAHFQAATLEATSKDKFVAVLPMYHCFALTATVLSAIDVGAEVCIPADKHARTVLKMIEDEGCTVLTAVPTLFSSILKRYDEEHYDVSTLRTGMIGGAPYFPEFFCEICDKLGMTLLPSIGATEATAGITAGKLTDSLELRSTSLGVPFPHVVCKIIDMNTQEDAPPNTVGELCVKGYNIMKCYYNMPEETDAVFADGCWFKTGDLARIREDGYIFYAGRKKELIIRGGENVIPSEVEELINVDERIEDVKVVGVPDRHYGEQVCAVVIRNGEISEDEIRGLVRSKVAKYKVPEYVLFVDEFPLTKVGKKDLKAIKALAKDAFDLESHREIKF